MLNQLMKKPLLILAIIVVLAALLRFYQLASLPPSLTWDEVAWGYNAYSLSIDGHDEFGKFLPYDYLVSFGDYKPPLYAYLTAVSVMLFGLTEFAVRVPSAFFGTLTVLLTYFLVKELFFTYRKDNKTNPHTTEMLALLSSFFLAISPWHILLSRAAFEANVASFLIVCGVWLFLRSLRTQSYLLIVSTIVFVLSIYTFNSTRIVAPLLFTVLVVTHFKKLWSLKKYAVISCLVGILLLLPIAKFLTSHEAKLRYEEVNIFSDVSIVKTANQEIANDNNSKLSKVIHNRRVAYTREYLKHYFDHFNPNFLFIKGDKNIKFSSQDVGQLYLWDVLFLVLGALFLFRKREGKWWIIPVWLLIGIIPAAAARETPHALRIESSLPMWQIVTAYGFLSVIGYIKKYKQLIVGGLLLLLLAFFGYFLFGYYTHYSKMYSSAWQYGYKEAIVYAQQNQNAYDRIEIGDRLERPYIYTLFYLKYDPKQFRKEADVKRDEFGFMHVDSFGKYYFYHDLKSVQNAPKKTLYIDSPVYLPKGAKVLQVFKYLDGQTEFVAFTR